MLKSRRGLWAAVLAAQLLPATFVSAAGPVGASTAPVRSSPLTPTSTSASSGLTAAAHTATTTTSRAKTTSTSAKPSATTGTAGAASATTTTTTVPGPPSPLAIHVAGNQLVNAAGQRVRLVGVDRSGTEYACAQGWGIFDGPSDAASVATMASWGTNTVRIPLNEDCWLGINGVDPQWSGANYQQAVEQYVGTLGAAGMVAILDLHWSAPGTELALGQQDMADADHSIAFWSSVASAFQSDPAVIFDLYNEPHDISWSCWLNGCTVPASGPAPAWQAAGMQSLVDAVRQAGATQPLLISGLDWAGDLSGWLGNQPQDPLHQEIAAVHVYDQSGCNNAACWQSNFGPVLASTPVLAAEVGQGQCDGTFSGTFFAWADANNVSYLAWTWDTWGCPESLITSFDGTPTPWGAAFAAHLATLKLAPLVAAQARSFFSSVSARLARNLMVAKRWRRSST